MMEKKTIIGPIAALAGCLLLLGACAYGYHPIVDQGAPGFDAGFYERDLAECRSYAAQIDPGHEAAGGALVGGAIGAALGALAGAAHGNPGLGAAVGAGLGGAVGAAQGGGHAAQDQEMIVRRCLDGRGYALLH